MNKENFILLADAYKYSHHKLYYPGTQNIYSYLESRGGLFDETVFYGLQYFIKEYLEGPAFTREDVDEAEAFLQQVFGRNDVFDRSRFDYILEKYNGHLPLRIKAVPEGSVVPVSNVLMTIESTDPNCFWLSNFVESLLLQVWYPSTVATLSREVRKVVQHAFEQTAEEDSFGEIDFVLNDFGFRGVSSVESAGLGGSAHLINFNGSDNLKGSRLAMQYYGASRPYGLSIPATEHSICTLLGEAGEPEVFRHILSTFPQGMVAVVSDSYDIFKACETHWGETFRDQLLQRDGRLVIRPDSGDPIQTLLRVFNILFDQFGSTVNSKGYHVLPPQIRVIQGDGVNYDSICDIYQALKKHGIAANNLVLGMGGALLQRLNRDTQKYAFKCSHAVVNGQPVDVQKHPVEMNAKGELQPSFKRSKAGRLKLIQEGEQLKTVREEQYPHETDLLEVVFENGVLQKEHNFETIRTRAGLSAELALA